MSIQNTFRENFWGIRPFKRHSLVLMAAGFFYIGNGIVYVTAEPTESRIQALSVALDFFPITVWGVVFIFVGLLALVSSRWPPVAETWGYMLLSGLSAGWSATYAWGVIIDDSPNSNFTAALIWALMAFLWWAISGFVNPDKTIVVVINDEGSDC